MKQPNQQDNLATLWQQQKTTDIDIAELKSKVSRMRLKQGLYVLLDFAGVFLGIATLIIFREKMSDVFFYMMFVVIALTFVFAAYLLYLRRFALFNQSQSTHDYLQTLKQQIKSNVRIARFTRHSCWATMLMLLVLWLVLGVFDDIPFDEWQRKTYLSLGFAAVFCIPTWFWARNRERKFELELSTIEKQGQQSDA